MSKTSAFCIADSQAQTGNIVTSLQQAAFSNDDISVLFPDKDASRDFAHRKETKMPEGATTGAGSGGVVGAGIGLLAGIGAPVIPGLGPFIAAGPIMAALSGGAIGAGVGGIAGAFIALGIREFESKRFEGKIKEGGILISVHCESGDEIRKAMEIYKRANAHDISSTGEASADLTKVA